MIYKGENCEFEIDDEDFVKVALCKWYLDGTNNGIIRNQYNISIGRLILRYDGPLEVDHVDRNIRNNKKENLRLATRSQNMANTKSRRGKYKGVWFWKERKCYVAEITINGKKKHLGCFYYEKEAALAYNSAAIKAWGEYAFQNVVEDGHQ
jgi:hypothetical protein